MALVGLWIKLDQFPRSSLDNGIGCFGHQCRAQKDASSIQACFNYEAKKDRRSLKSLFQILFLKRCPGQKMTERCWNYESQGMNCIHLIDNFS